jgi:hypothetical protein
MAVIGFGFLGAPFVPGVAGPAEFPWFFAFFAALATAAFVASIFFLRYRVVFDVESLNVRFLFNEQIIPLTDVIDTDVLDGRARELIVYLRGGHRLRLSGLLQDFDGLVAKIQGVKTSRTDSAEKIADRRRAVADSKGAMWIMCGGLAFVGVAAIAVWVLQQH